MRPSALRDEVQYLKKISVSIPTQRKLKDHIEREINSFRRGKSHTSPSHEKDVVGLQGIYSDEKAHVYKPGRKLQEGDHAKDFLNKDPTPRLYKL